MLDTVSARLPPLIKAGTIVLNEGDMLIHAPGFEDRTLAVCDVLKPQRGSRAILLDYKPFDGRNRMKAVREGLANIGIPRNKQSLLSYDRFNPGDFETRLEAELRERCASKVVLDISTMSKLAIMLTLWSLKKVDTPVTVLYSEAEHYGPSETEFNEARNSNDVHQPSLQIFSGIHGVIRVDSLASVAMQGQPTAALVFMSFNDSLTQSLLNTVYPTRLLLINGTPPVHSWREAATAWIHENVRKEWGDDNPTRLDGSGLPQRSVSTLDYRETVVLLMRLYWELSASYRILLAPAGSKLQAVGCCIMKALHPDIHVEYPSPQGFLKVYSEGAGTMWQVEFGSVDDLISQLRREEVTQFLQIG